MCVFPHPQVDANPTASAGFGSSVASGVAWTLGCARTSELRSLFEKYGDSDGTGIMQFTQLSEAAKLVPDLCSNHDVFTIFKSMAPGDKYGHVHTRTHSLVHSQTHTAT